MSEPTYLPCPVPGCDWMVKAGVIMCKQHWPMVAPGLRASIQTAHAQRLTGDEARLIREAVASITGKPITPAVAETKPAGEQLDMFPV